MGFSQFDQTLIEEIYEKLYKTELMEDECIELISSLENISIGYLTSLFNSYKRMCNVQ